MHPGFGYGAVLLGSRQACEVVVDYRVGRCSGRVPPASAKRDVPLTISQCAAECPFQYGGQQRVKLGG